MMYDQEKEKREAIQAGEKALNSLYLAAKDLNSARNWGYADLLGGGFLISMVKRSKMQNARAHMEEAKYNLRNFSKELRDVEMSCDLHIETDDFLSFADWFFDGVVADWMVQDRIHKAGSQVNEAIRRVEHILEQLRYFR